MAETKLTGSCLCGSVKYEIMGDEVAFYHCHCNRCRKVTGTGHASNIMVSPETSIKWLQGEELLKRYKVPEAERFFSNFCSNCGSPMPRVVPEIGAVIVPAGSLDTEPNIKPEARIFWESRSDWSCSDTELPVFPEYPK